MGIEIPKQFKKIVIADDNRDIRKIISNLFVDLGHDVKVVEDGYALLGYLENNVPDVIILDLMMPRKGGIAIISTIKQISPFSCLIIYTGHSEYENTIYARKAEHFIVKGENINKLISAVEESS
ncbi:Signal transduction response regulator, receiver region domain protein [Candidatus Omnitrophus magneticus]|uniref:Signal transduction response regulator, receiver region domain protein n=1 Tax=Candidatus Omnitrophus magneticus TaxID=1609969 RepID=A0A0F0CNJ8_9BACT|nr:Signal transduction response regulator, receiver region domain protein [Candidatus Omnitrophus magneticus]